MPQIALPIVEVFERLGAAVLVGGALGLNRELRHKAAGLRTLALVGLGASIAALTISGIDGSTDVAAASRVLQGVLTGVGFLGAGVILHPSHDATIVGLTTAASVWVVAALGYACGLGLWPIAAAAAILTLVVLVLGSYLERAIRRRWGAPQGT